MAQSISFHDFKEQVESAIVTFSLTSGVPKLFPREELRSTISVLHLKGKRNAM